MSIAPIGAGTRPQVGAGGIRRANAYAVKRAFDGCCATGDGDALVAATGRRRAVVCVGVAGRLGALLSGGRAVGVIATTCAGFGTAGADPVPDWMLPDGSKRVPGVDVGIGLTLCWANATPLESASATARVDNVRHSAQ